MANAGRSGGGLALLSAAALIAGGAYVAKEAYRDSRGNLNVSVGPLDFGECADLLSRREVSHPATDAQLLSGIQSIGRVCGFCADMAINVNGAPYEVCIDPETLAYGSIEASGQDAGLTTIDGYMMTIPVAPDGYLYSALDANPGFCTALIGELEASMYEEFGRAFDADMNASLAVKVGIAPGSHSACETGSTTTTSTSP